MKTFSLIAKWPFALLGCCVFSVQRRHHYRLRQHDGGLHRLRECCQRYVRENQCAVNVFAGILVTGSANRLDGNHCTGGQRGFNITGSDNLLIRNSAQGASIMAYDTAAGNHQAALITSPGLNFANTSPWANFSF